MEMYQQEQQETYPMIQQGVPMQASEGALQYQLDSDQIIDDIEHNLKGETLHINPRTGDEEWKVRKGISPILNEEGVNTIITILKSHLTKIFILSDLDMEVIISITKDIGDNIIDDFEDNWERYGLKNGSGGSTVVRTVTNTVYATLSKAKHGNYLKFLRTTHNISEIQSRNIQQAAQPEREDTSSVIRRLLKKR